jgi:hypothetical protein
MVLSGCGRQPASGGDNSSSREKSGQVALEYAQALFSGNFDKARALVEADSQSAFQLVRLGVDPKTLTVRDIGIGSTAVNGDRASTTLTGTICRKDTAGAATGAPEDCITNHDPSTSNPIFKVAVARQPNGKWMVSLKISGATQNGASNSAAPSVTSSVS